MKRMLLVVLVVLVTACSPQTSEDLKPSEYSEGYLTLLEYETLLRMGEKNRASLDEELPVIKEYVKKELERRERE